MNTVPSHSHHEVSSFVLFPYSLHHILPCYRPKSIGSSLSWTKTFKTINQNKTFFLLFSQEFCHSNRKQTDTLSLSVSLIYLHLLALLSIALLRISEHCLLAQFTDFFSHISSVILICASPVVTVSTEGYLSNYQFLGVLLALLKYKHFQIDGNVLRLYPF